MTTIRRPYLDRLGEAWKRCFGARDKHSNIDYDNVERNAQEESERIKIVQKILSMASLHDTVQFKEWVQLMEVARCCGENSLSLCFSVFYARTMNRGRILGGECEFLFPLLDILNRDKEYEMVRECTYSISKCIAGTP